MNKKYHCLAIVYRRYSWGLEKCLDFLKNIEKSPSLADNAVLQRDPVPGCHRAAPLARWWQAAVIRNHQLFFDLFLPGPSTNRKYYVFVSTRFCICRTAWCSVSERGAGFVSAALSTEENWVHVFFSLSYSHSSKHLCGSLLKSAMFQNGSERILDIAFRVCESCPAFIWFLYNTATK